MLPSPATSARWIGLVLILLFATQGLVSSLRSIFAVESSFFLCLYIHLWVSIYDGLFVGWRRLTWLLLIISAFLAESRGFFGYVLPWGWLVGWLATAASNVGGPNAEALAQAIWSLRDPAARGLAQVIVLVAAAALLALDFALMRERDWRQGFSNLATRQGRIAPWRRLALLGGIIVVGVVTARLQYASETPSLAENPLLTPVEIMPEWHFLPFYAILRSVPSKLGAVIVMFAAMLLPIVTPWIGSGQCRIGATRSGFAVAAALLAISWILLGLLGAQAPEGALVWLARALTLYCFAFFLILVPLMRLRAQR